jgi:predicted site-specific integrase-resolvase
MEDASETHKPSLAWRVQDFCKEASISPSTFWKWVALGRLKVIRFGGRTLVPSTEVQRFKREGIQ